MTEPFEYWLNIYPGFIDMGGRSREEADRLHREFWADENERLDCRRVRYVPGKGLVDVTDRKQKRTYNVSPENRAAASERMREMWRKKKQEAK